MAGWPRASARRCSKAASTTVDSGQLLDRLVHGLLHAARRRPAVVRAVDPRRRCARTTRSASKAAARRARSARPAAIIERRSSTRWRARRQPCSTCRRRPRKSGAPSSAPATLAAEIGRAAMYEFDYQQRDQRRRRRDMPRRPRTTPSSSRAGMTLIPTLKQRLAKPSRPGRSRRASPSLKGIKGEGDGRRRSAR